VRCEHVVNRLTEYQLGMLDEAESAEIAAHLETCADCRAELQALERLDALVAPAEQVKAPDDLWDGVEPRLRPRRGSWWRIWLASPRPALALAAAMLLAAAGLWLGLRGPVGRSSAEVLASDYQQQQIVAQWSQPLADDAALGMMFAGLNGVGEER